MRGIETKHKNRPTAGDAKPKGGEAAQRRSRPGAKPPQPQPSTASPEPQPYALSKNAFAVLDCIRRNPGMKQQELAESARLSIGTVNSVLKKLAEAGLVTGEKRSPKVAGLVEDAKSALNKPSPSVLAADGKADGRKPPNASRTTGAKDAHRKLTPAGLQALEPFAVDNAIIMAAGLSSRFAPISYEKPKGLLSVRGEILIERLIEQLQEAGIDDIVVVVGYKQEAFFYLEDKYGVTIVVNNEYASRNNNSSIYAARDMLGNSLICSSDNYYVENPFSKYEWAAYYSAEHSDGPTKEWCMSLGPHNRIKAVTVGGADALYMIGHAYFDRQFSERFRQILIDEYDLPQTAEKLWEELYIEHIDELPMAARDYGRGIIYEFDSLDELREFDPFFLENVDSDAFNNITATLGCTRGEIRDIYPLKQGLTNLSCHFRTDEGEYVYRHPGVGTEQLIDREAEAKALHLAKELGIDDTFIHADPQKGWKLSRFIPDCRQLDPHDDEQLELAMDIARRLHEEDVRIDREFDFYKESKRYEALLKERVTIDAPDFQSLSDKIDRLHGFVMEDVTEKCLCHNDFFYLNLLMDREDKVSLIDWEYAGMSDYANDFGTFVVTCELAPEEALRALEHYFKRKPTDAELRHNLAFVAFAGWCWYVWSLVKESEGDNVGEWLYIYYRYAKEYMDKSLELYEAEPAGGKKA